MTLYTGSNESPVDPRSSKPLVTVHLTCVFLPCFPATLQYLLQKPGRSNVVALSLTVFPSSLAGAATMALLEDTEATPQYLGVCLGCSSRIASKFFYLLNITDTISLWKKCRCVCMCGVESVGKGQQIFGALGK